MKHDTNLEKRKRLAKILVPILLILIIVLIWVLKTYYTPDSINEQNIINEDFKLEAASIDLDALKAYELPIIIDFGADTCVPCKEMAPVLKMYIADMQGKAIIKFVDVWEYPDAAADFPIQVIPTQVFYNSDGTPYVPSDDIDIMFYLYNYKDTDEHAFTVHQGGLTEEQMSIILKDLGVSE